MDVRNAFLLIMYLACVLVSDHKVRIMLALSVLCVAGTITSSQAEHFGSGKTLCGHVDDLDIDMPFSANLKHLLLIDDGKPLDVAHCGETTFEQVQDDSGAVKWKGPESSTFLKPSLSIFLTLGPNGESLKPAQEASLIVARAEPEDQLKANTQLSLVEMGLKTAQNGKVQLVGRCGDTRLELDYVACTMPRTHFLTYNDVEVSMGYSDIWSNEVHGTTVKRKSAFKTTSASPVVLNASASKLGELISLAVYDQYMDTSLAAILEALSAYALQKNQVFSSLLARYRRTLLTGGKND